jgi:hypothetical protein
MSGYVEGKSKTQILDELARTAQPGSPVHEQQRMGIIVRATEDIEASLAGVNRSLALLDESMKENAQSSDRLAAKVYWLNVVLTVATVAGTMIAGYTSFYRPTTVASDVATAAVQRFTWAFAQNFDNSLHEAELCRQSLADSVYAQDLETNFTRQGQSNIFLYSGVTETYRVHAFHTQQECETALTGLKAREGAVGGRLLQQRRGQ